MSTSEQVATSVATWLLPSEENDKSSVPEVATSDPEVATSSNPTPELVTLGRKDRKKIDPNTLVEKIVRVKALGGEEVLVQAIQQNTGRLIALNQETQRQMFITVNDIE